MKIILFFLFFTFVKKSLAEQEWIDPFNMNTGLSRPVDECVCPTPTLNVLSHYKRAINLVLSSVSIDRTDHLNFKGFISVDIPIEYYDFLKEFARGSVEDVDALHKTDQILTDIFTKPSVEKLTDVLLSWADHVYFMFFNRSTGIILSILFVFFISYKLLRANFTLSSVVSYLIFLAWIFDFAFTWMRLLQDHEINKIADSTKYQDIPSDCDPSKMSYFQYWWTFISSDDECRKYYQITLRDEFWSVSPFIVLSHQFGAIILTPASYIGSALAGFTQGIIAGLPWPLNLLLLPVLLLFMLVLTCMLLSFATKTSFHVNFFHLLQFKFGNENSKNIGDKISGKNLTKLLQMTHRATIEDVKEKDSKKNKHETVKKKKDETFKIKKDEPVKKSEKQNTSTDVIPVLKNSSVEKQVQTIQESEKSK